MPRKANTKFLKIFITFFILALATLFFFIDNKTEILAGNLWPPDSVSVDVSAVKLGTQSNVAVETSGGTSLFAWCISVDFGDGSPKETGACFSDPVLGACRVNFSHQYSAVGSYTITATSCDCDDSTKCKSASAIAVVNPPFVCGNGITEPPMEECDDGNTVSGDGCDSSCHREVAPSVCGNGIIEPGESCDDGNTVSGDGCDSSCQIEGIVPSPVVGDDNNPLRYNTFGELVDGIVGVIFWIGAIVGPLLIILGGFMMIFSGADPARIALGKKIILYTAVIFAIIIIIKSLTYFFRGDLSFS